MITNMMIMTPPDTPGRSLQLSQSHRNLAVDIPHGWIICVRWPERPMRLSAAPSRRSAVYGHSSEPLLSRSAARITARPGRPDPLRRRQRPAQNALLAGRNDGPRRAGSGRRRRRPRAPGRFPASRTSPARVARSASALPPSAARSTSRSVAATRTAQGSVVPSSTALITLL